LGTFAALFAAGLSLAGCATQAVQEREPLAQRIANARTRADHEALAAWFEREATEARERAETHRKMGQHYERWAYTYYRQVPDAGLSGGFVRRCETLVRLHEQAAEENLALAKLHRQVAAEATK
jgi:hypothetical protein